MGDVGDDPPSRVSMLLRSKSSVDPSEPQYAGGDAGTIEYMGGASLSQLIPKPDGSVRMTLKCMRIIRPTPVCVTMSSFFAGAYCSKS